ncbi:unnamed protein product [Prorocentrum cordatum]|uniref:WW domain-containing protein n=1 Tax=Prorocentrum cordatum TaxID=2364126 RepID=A0ABN9SFB9_9DINO|nr:unnamed protein product [Polarella glacialis]
MRLLASPGLWKVAGCKDAEIDKLTWIVPDRKLYRPVAPVVPEGVQAYIPRGSDPAGPRWRPGGVEVTRMICTVQLGGGAGWPWAGRGSLPACSRERTSGHRRPQERMPLSKRCTLPPPVRLLVRVMPRPLVQSLPPPLAPHALQDPAAVPLAPSLSQHHRCSAPSRVEASHVGAAEALPCTLAALKHLRWRARGRAQQLLGDDAGAEVEESYRFDLVSFSDRGGARRVWKEVKQLATGLKRGGKAPSEPPPGSGGGAGPLKVGGPDRAAPGGMVGGSSGSSKALTVNEFVARTKRVREQERSKGDGSARQELGCTKQELVAYARYLGMDPVVDGDLLWIAEQALEAPLPSEWTEHHDSADRVFYYNVQTHASSWTHPLEQLHRDTYKQIISFRSGDMPAEEQRTNLSKLQVECDAAEKKAHVELQAWTEHTDEQGQKFYYNRDKQTSVWTDPRPARCHCLYLQMKAVKVLGKHCGVSDDVKDLTPAPLGAGGGALGAGASLAGRPDALLGRRRRQR